MAYDELVAELRDQWCDTKRTLPCKLEHDAADAIVTLQARVAKLEQLLTHTGLLAAQEEHNALRHDIARHVEICASQAQEIEELRADLAAARAALAAVSERIDRGYYHTAKALIDAALAGEARHDK